MKHQYDKEDELETIRRNILSVAKALGKTPTQVEYKRACSNGMMSLHQILYRFGGKWTEACLHADLQPNPCQQPPKNTYAEAELLDEFIRVANLLKKLPTAHEFTQIADISWTPYKRRWGPGWIEVKASMALQCSDRLCFTPLHVAKHDGNCCCDSLNMQLSLINKPRNELETVILFSILANDLGYRIESFDGEFPDATLLDVDGNHIQAEFEFISSNYLQHGHPPDFEGLCICWRKDVPLGNIAILSLEEHLRRSCP